MTIGNSLAILIAIVASAGGVAVAQPSPAAESLFREGKKLLDAGELDEACKKLQASEDLEASSGTELNLADCYEKKGSTATAWGMFLKAAATAKAKKETKRATEAKRRAKKLEDKLAYLTIKIADRVDGLAITRDTNKVDEATWDQRVPIDPGKYKIEVTAPGHVAWSKRVTVDESDDRTVEVPALAVLDKPVEDPKPNKPEPKPRPEVTKTGRRHAGLTYTLAAIGVAGAGAGTFFGLRARSLSSDADGKCPNQMCLDPVALDQNDRARSAARFANIGFAVGGAALIGATIAWFTGRPEKTEHVAIAPAIGGGSIGLAIGGSL